MVVSMERGRLPWVIWFLMSLAGTALMTKGLVVMAEAGMPWALAIVRPFALISVAFGGMHEGNKVVFLGALAAAVWICVTVVFWLVRRALGSRLTQ